MGPDVSAPQWQKFHFPIILMWQHRNLISFEKQNARPCIFFDVSFRCTEVLIWSIVTSHHYALILSLTTALGQYTTAQISRVGKKKKILINQEFSGKEFQFNLPKEEASCTSLKHVRVQGFKGLWHRLTASGQRQLLSALVLGVGQGLTC